MEVLGLRMPLQQAGPYAPRDVVNAPAVKAAIARRSAQRGDAPAVREWLLNHFYRHAIGNLQPDAPALQPVASMEQARRLFGTAPPPAWLADRIADAQRDGNALPWWLDPVGGELLALEQRLVEFLGSRAGTPLEGKLMRVNAPQALALWAAEHAAIEARRNGGRHVHQPAAVRVAWQGRRGLFVELLPDSAALRAEMAYESQAMQHCLGQFAERRALRGGYGEHYAQACESGALRLFSYRSAQQHPHVTISAHVGPGGRLTIDQIKGKQNQPPVARYRDELMAFLNTLDTERHTPPDAAAIGVVRLDGGWRLVSEVTEPQEQLRLVHLHPQLIRDLPRPSPMAQWIVAARRPELLRGLALAPGVAGATGHGGGGRR